MRPYVNIGCGARFHPEWINLDIGSRWPEVREHDIRSGLPFADGSVEVCYHSHVLEHLTPEQGERLVSECFRVLSTDAIIRVVVPDLEAIVRLYLAALDRATAGDPSAEADYDWMMLELFDQTVRTEGGGRLGRFLSDPGIPNKSFIRSRVGDEAEGWWNRTGRPISLVQRLRGKGPRRLFNRARVALGGVLLRGVAGRRAYESLREGLFRDSGEIHRWMYDRFSLGRLLRSAGFQNVVVCNAFESGIPGFSAYELDAADGRVRKPDSLFMEGRKP